MRLLFFSNEFPNPVQPTKSVFNRQLAYALAADHDVRAIVPVPWVDELRAGKSKRFDIVDGIETYYPRFYYTPRFGREHFSWWLWHSIRSTAERLFKTWRPDAVIGYWAHPDGEVAVRLAHGLGVPGIVMVAGSDVLILMKKSRRLRDAIRRGLATADAIVSVSRDMRDFLVDAGLAPERIHVFDQGVDASKFFPGNRAEARRRLGLKTDGRHLVWVGRMVDVKGLDILIEACALLKRRGESFRLHLVGDGSLRKTLEAQVATLGLNDVVDFAGAQPHGSLPDWYRSADLTVMPSRSEGIPNVLRESLACGTPFVASRVGGIPELAIGLEAICRLVPAENPLALADALALALKSCDPHPGGVLGVSPSWTESAAVLVRLIEGLRNENDAKVRDHFVAPQPNGDNSNVPNTSAVPLGPR